MKLSKKNLISVVALVLIALGSNYAEFGKKLLSSQNQTSTQQSNHQSNNNANSSHGQKWSNTSPAINQWHVFEGEINRKGKPVGFHSRPGGQDPANARLVKIKSKANRAGVYTATIEVRDGNKWLQKFSSFFPDKMNRQDVTQAVLHAYNNSKNPNAQPWRGPSGHKFNIEGYTLPKGDINTAFPVYVRD